MTLTEALYRIRRCGVEARAAEVLLALGAEPAHRGAIARRLGMPFSTTLNALWQLEAMGWVAYRKEDGMNIFYITADGSLAIQELLEQSGRKEAG